MQFSDEGVMAQDNTLWSSRRSRRENDESRSFEEWANGGLLRGDACYEHGVIVRYEKPCACCLTQAFNYRMRRMTSDRHNNSAGHPNPDQSGYVSRFVGDRYEHRLVFTYSEKAQSAGYSEYVTRKHSI